MSKNRENGIGGGYKAAKVFKQYDPEDNTVVDRAFLVKEKGAKAHFKRNAGSYGGAAVGAGGGLAAAGAVAKLLKEKTGGRIAGLSGKGRAVAALAGAGIGRAAGDRIDELRAKSRLGKELKRQKKVRGSAYEPLLRPGGAPGSIREVMDELRQAKRDPRLAERFNMAAIDEALTYFEDLGEMRPDYGNTGLTLDKEEKNLPKKKVYPRLSLYGREKALGIPDKGTAMVKYRVTSRGYRELDGKATHDSEIEIQDMTPVMDAPKVEMARGTVGEALVEFGSGGIMAQGRRALALKKKVWPGAKKLADSGASDDVLYAKLKPLLQADRRLRHREAMGRARQYEKEGVGDPKRVRDSWNSAMKNPEFLKRKQFLARGTVGEAVHYFAGVAGTRERDGMGRFRADETGGADPVSMRAAYGTAGAALAGAGLLAGTRRGRDLSLRAGRGAMRAGRALAGRVRTLAGGE